MFLSILVRFGVLETRLKVQFLDTSYFLRQAYTTKLNLKVQIYIEKGV